MKRVKRVEDLNIRIVRAQGIVGVGVTIRTFIVSSPAAACHRMVHRWIACRPGFFLPVRVLSRLFRRLFLEHLQAEFEHLTFFGTQAAMADRSAFNRSLAELRRIDWVVFAKRPFAGPEQVLAYLGRYTHRVAIANSRLVTLAGDEVSFRWRDYRHHDKIKVMTLAADEFIRRFLLHTLPDGFHRIRHYGFLANGHRAAKLALCRHLLEAPTSAPTAPAADYRERYRQLTGRSLDICPVCGGRLIPLGLLPRAWCNRPQAYCDTS